MQTRFHEIGFTICFERISHIAPLVNGLWEHKQIKCKTNTLNWLTWYVKAVGNKYFFLSISYYIPILFNKQDKGAKKRQPCVNTTLYHNCVYFWCETILVGPGGGMCIVTNSWCQAIACVTMGIAYQPLSWRQYRYDSLWLCAYFPNQPHICLWMSDDSI